MLPEERSALGVRSNEPGRPVGTGLALATISVVLPLLSTLAVGLRSYWRFWAKTGAWGWDDVLAILSQVFFIVSAAYAFISAQYGLGNHDLARINFDKVMSAVFLCGIFYLVALALIKVSVAISVLRFSFKRRYRWPTIGLAIITIIIYAFCGIWSIVFCGTSFQKRLNTTCQGTQVNIALVATITTVVTDAGCVFIPIFVIRNLHISRRTKIGLMAAMAFGMLPLVAAVIRIPFSPIWSHMDLQRQVYYIVFGPLLAVLETGLALIASSLPVIGGMFKWFLKPAAASTGTHDTTTADTTATPGSADLEPGSTWIKYVWGTKSTSTTRSIPQTEESSSA